MRLKGTHNLYYLGRFQKEGKGEGHRSPFLLYRTSHHHPYMCARAHTHAIAIAQVQDWNTSQTWALQHNRAQQGGTLPSGRVAGNTSPFSFLHTLLPLPEQHFCSRMPRTLNNICCGSHLCYSICVSCLVTSADVLIQSEVKKYI